MTTSTIDKRRAELGSFIVDSHGTILGFDPAMELLTQWPAVEVVGQHKDLSLSSGFEERIHPVATHPLYDGEIPVRPMPSNVELTLYSKDGTRIDVETSVTRLDGPGDRMMVTVLRMLARSARPQMTRGFAGRDERTGLPDREAFATRLAADFLTASTTARPLALILLDVDHLREVNDRLGHAAGDEVLKKIAGIIRVSVDDEYRIARLGDDDFAILLPNSGRGEARKVAASLRSTIERFRFFGNEELEDVRITASLGSASFPADADGQKELVDRAREALDEARSMGRNRVWCYLRRPRVPVQVPVYFDSADDSLLVGYSRDLSPSGLFLQTSAAIDIGMRCAFAFSLPGHQGRVHVIGRVVRSVAPELEDDQASRIPGLGVEFERFGGRNDRRAIVSFLHGRESESLRPENGILSV